MPTWLDDAAPWIGRIAVAVYLGVADATQTVTSLGDYRTQIWPYRHFLAVPLAKLVPASEPSD